MNLALLRKWDKIHPQRIHQSIPRTDEPEAKVAPLIGITQVSQFCLVGLQAKHAWCKASWCKCPCHVDHEDILHEGWYG